MNIQVYLTFTALWWSAPAEMRVKALDTIRQQTKRLRLVEDLLWFQI